MTLLRQIYAWVVDGCNRLVGYTGFHTARGEPIFEWDNLDVGCPEPGLVLFDARSRMWVCRHPGGVPRSTPLKDREHCFQEPRPCPGK